MRATLMTAVLAAAVTAFQPGAFAQDIPDYVQAAVDSADRPDADRERDAARKPADVLALSSVKPGDHIIEIAGFGQYYTRMLSDIVGPEGHVDVFDLPYTEGRAGEASRAFEAGHPNMTYHLGDYNEAEWPQDADVVFNILYYHDLSLNEIDIAKMNQGLFDALKPGGTYIIVDHKAEPGSGRRDTESVHRIDGDVIREEVQAAGFELAVDSDLLAHPEDDHTAMIFAPGTRGATDRVLLVFKKPE